MNYLRVVLTIICIVATYLIFWGRDYFVELTVRVRPPGAFVSELTITAEPVEGATSSSVALPPVAIKNAVNGEPKSLVFMENTEEPVEYFDYQLPGTKIVPDDPLLDAKNLTAGRDMKLVIGVLTSSETLRSRLLPLIDTSIQDEEVMIFLPNNVTSQPAVEMIASQLERKKGAKSNIHTIKLDYLENMKASIRNSWVDLPGLQYMMKARPDADWYSIIDDDTYLLMNNVRSILGGYKDVLKEKELYLGDYLLFGEGGGCRLVRNTKTGERRLIPSSRRVKVPFVVGGSGIFINQKAARKMEKYLRRCIQNHLHPAGDVRLGACMMDAKVNVTKDKRFVKDVFFRAIGELELYRKVEFPASFHRLRKAAWYYALRKLETSLPKDQLIRWSDIRNGFPVSDVFYPALYFPRRYANYTAVFRGNRTDPPIAARVRKYYEKYGKGLDCFKGTRADEW